MLAPDHQKRLGNALLALSLAGAVGLAVHLSLSLADRSEEQEAGDGRNPLECCMPPDPSRATLTPRETHPVPDLLGGDPAHGELLFRGACAGCHGPKGDGSRAFEVPPIRQSELPETRAAAILDGRGIMPPFAHVLEDSDLRDLVSFLTALDGS
ncbi:MAG: cytochrome c [Deltaproteobacteria bacterium]|nr:cytochrome c [Deltaproteobacteria bacterium]